MTIFAGTWINLQDAFVAENNALGDWGQIGYTAPGAKQGTSSTDFKSKEFEYTSTEKNWEATNLNKLNDCAAKTKGWILTATATGSNSGTMTVAAGGDAGCKTLTPSFDGLARAAAQ